MEKKGHSRRQFIKLNSLGGVGAALTMGVLGSGLAAACGSGKAAAARSAAGSRIDENDPANLKISHRLKAKASEDDMLFLKQIGVRWVRAEFAATEGSFEQIQALQQVLAKYDIKIYSATHPSCSSKLVHLGQPGRDKDIETYHTFLRSLGRLGIGVASYAFHTATTYGTGTTQRRGYTAREFKLNDFRTKIEKQRYEREYNADEIWANYTYMMNAVLPVAEEAKVKLALHPDDPPVAKMNGVAKIFTHYDGLKRADEIAGNSKYWGLCFCVGTWAEGGDKMGKDVFEVIRDFGNRGRLFEIHFRNVTGALPDFAETFPDDGYMDMSAVMKALREVRFDGSAMPDHVPRVIGDQGILRAGTAYCIAYMRALLRHANEQVG